MSLEYIRGIQDNVDKSETVKLLRKALADEYIAAHQYWTQAKIVQGIQRDEIVTELLGHRDEEMGHANLLMDRILQLGGNPELRPLDWDSFTECSYKLNASWDQKAVLDIAIDSERCAVTHYTQIAQFVQVRDDTTYDLVMKIIDDEYKHITDLSKIRDIVNGIDPKAKNGNIR